MINYILFTLMLSFTGTLVLFKIGFALGISVGLMYAVAFIWGIAAPSIAKKLLGMK